MITTEFRDDGFGAQYQTIVYGALFSELVKNHYAYRAITKIGEYTDIDFSSIDSFINVRKAYENLYEREDIHSIKIVPFPVLRNAVEENLDELLESNTKKILQSVFLENKNTDIYNKDFFNIAIHIRRHNDYDIIKNQLRPYPNLSYYKRLTEKLKEIYHDKKYRIHIYSQGNLSDFADFQESTTVLHIDETSTQKHFFDTFLGLVIPDVLVTSNSSFSYTAALLTDALVYYEECVHPPAKKWRQIKDILT